MIMVDFKQERGDKMNTRDIPLSEEEIKVYAAIAKEMNEFNNSKSLATRGCRAVGLGYFQIAAIKYSVKTKKRRMVSLIKAIPSIIDAWIDHFNQWLLRL